MELSAKKGVQHIVLALSRLGLREVIICPGSRNAPFTLSFNRHGGFHCTSIRDERSAAFFTLGKAIELQQPVALVCTSGSASLNFAPAVSEAYYQRIPLIVITADRPKEWTHQGDGQTINQTDVYHNFIRKSYDLKGDAVTPTELWHIDRSVSEGFAIAAELDKGPVHFNVPLFEPLYEIEKNITEYPKVFQAGRVVRHLPEKGIKSLQQQFTASKRVMILAGQKLPDKIFQGLIEKMAVFENTIVFTESTSNIHHTDFIENIDRCITHLHDEEAQRLMPDLLITVGGAVVSKRIKVMLRKTHPSHHWNINPFQSTMDTYQSLTHAIAMEPDVFFAQFLPGLKDVESDYRKVWQEKKNHLKTLHEDFCRQAEYSDFAAFREIYQHLPADVHLHLSNSSPIRYAQLFDNSRVASSWSNRGTSGIDGCTSTAMGCAASAPKKNFLLITGDVAFNYDNNALWNEEETGNLKIIVLNNGGGNIFRIIPGPCSVPELDHFFETSMQSDVSKLAEHYKWNYLAAHDSETLKTSLKKFFASGTKRTILEIFTDAKKNPVVLNQYWKYLKDKSN